MADAEKIPPQDIEGRPNKEKLHSPESKSSSEDITKMSGSLREGLRAEINTKESSKSLRENLKEKISAEKTTMDALKELRAEGTKERKEAVIQEEKTIQEENEELLINPSYTFTPDDSIYPTTSLKRTESLLNTNLEQPLQDIEGFAKGLVVDSGKSVVKLAGDFIKDLVYFVPDIIQSRKKS